MKPFDKVLVRVTPDWEWMPHIFSKEVDGVFFTIDGQCWPECIPYEGNEQLLGTTDSPTPPEPEQNFNFGDKVEVSEHKVNWYKAIFYEMEQLPCNRPYIVVRKGIGTDAWRYCRNADW